MGPARAFALVVAAAAGGCALPPITADAPRAVQGQVVTPYAIHEECLHAKDGDRVDYRYEASSPVDFSIHYTDGNTVVLPIARDGSDADAGVFAPRLDKEYCLTWEAGPAGALLDYRIGIRHEGP